MADGHRVDKYKLKCFLEQQRVRASDGAQQTSCPDWLLFNDETDPRVEPEAWDKEEKQFESIFIGPKLLQTILLCAGRGSATEAVWQHVSSTLQRVSTDVDEDKPSLPVRDLDLRAALIALQQLTITSATTGGITPACVHEVVTALHTLFSSPIHAVGLPLSIRFTPLWITELVRKIPSSLMGSSLSVLHDLLLRSFNGLATDDVLVLHMVKLATTLMGQGAELMSAEQVRSLLAALLHLADASFSSAMYLELVAHIFQSFGELSVRRKSDSLIEHIRPHGPALTCFLMRILKSSTEPVSWPLHGCAAKFLIPILNHLLTRDELLHWGPLLHAQLKAVLAFEERDDMGRLSVHTTNLRCDVFEAWTALVHVMRGDFIGGLWDCVEAIERRMAPDYWKPTVTPLSLQQDLMLKAMGPIGIEQKDEQHDAQGDDAHAPSDDKQQNKQEGSGEKENTEEAKQDKKTGDHKTDACSQGQEEAEEKKQAMDEEQAAAPMPAAAESEADQSDAEDEFINDDVPYWRRYDRDVRESSEDEDMAQDQRRERDKVPLGQCTSGQNREPTLCSIDSECRN